MTDEQANEAEQYDFCAEELYPGFRVGGTYECAECLNDFTGQPITLDCQCSKTVCESCVVEHAGACLCKSCYEDKLVLAVNRRLRASRMRMARAAEVQMGEVA